MNMTEWLTACVDDDEAAAFDAARADGTDWRVRNKVEIYAPLREPGLRGLADIATCEAALHVARYDPARALREVAFKRKILARAALEVVDGSEVGYDVRDALDEALRDMAEVYSDRPGYQQAIASDPAQ